MKIIYYFILFAILTPTIILSQSLVNNTDSTKHTQYRSGVDLPEGYQSYEEKYRGKTPEEEKRMLYPHSRVSSSTGIWTELNPNVPRVDYLGIYFVNIDTGWACGDLGTIIKTTDAGDNWVTEETNTTTPILKVRSFNGQLVIASSFDGLILRSTNGGESWVEVTSGVTGDLWGLEMINDTLGWACGNYNSLTKTTDRGLSWQRVFTPGYTGNLWWIDFINENYGFIAADGNVLRTTDGGLNWEIIQAGDAYPLYSIDVIDSLHITAGGYGGTSYAAKNIYSSDGGNTWINGGQTTTDPINCIKYINTDTGYITMSEVGIWKTINRGQSWQLLEPDSPNFQGEYELQLFSPQNIGYDAGSYLRIFKANGNLDLWNKLIINDDFSDVFFTSEKKGYVTANRVVFKTSNSGINWQKLQNFPSSTYIAGIKSITFIDSLIGFIGGPPCRIVKTTDAGDSWQITNVSGLSDTMGAITRIFFINSTTGWAVNDRGGIINTTDVGGNWFAQLSAGISVIFRSVYFIDSANGWTANLNARPFKTSDSGINWIQQSQLSIGFSRDVFFKNHQNGFLLESDKLYKTTDEGNTFNLIPDITGYGVAARFSHYGDSTIFITGYKTYRSVDGGESWYSYPELDLTKLSGLSLLNSGLGYAVGDMGLILRYFDSTYTPVEFISFSANVNDGNVYLIWTTATETNNQGFDVEKYREGHNEWARIGYVPGSGTTTEKKLYSFTDGNVTPGKYYYRLKQIDFDGTFKYSKEVEAEISAPLMYSLEQNFPNPFNPTTKIIYSIPLRGKVKLIIYDLLGNKIKTLVNEEKPKGKYTVEFNGSNLSSGVYICRLIYGKYSITKKLVLLK